MCHLSAPAVFIFILSRLKLNDLDGRLFVSDLL